MAITDGLIAHVYAETGDATIIDKVSGGTLTGTGTRSIVDISGEKAWNLTSAAYTMGFTPKAVNPSGSTELDNGVTFAIRYRLNVMGSNDFSFFAGVMTDGGTEALNLGRNGSSSTRFRYKTTNTDTSTELATTGVIHTAVFVYSPNWGGGTSVDRLLTWINTVSRVGTDHDLGATGFTGTSETYDRLYFKAPDTMDIDLLDLVYWDRELTDAEAAAVADDLRTELPVGGGSDTTPDAFSFTDQTDVAVSTLTTSNTVTITGIDTATAISVTGGEMSINSGAFTSSSTTVSVNDTVQLRVTSSASNSTAVAVTLDVGGVTDEWTVTTIAAVATGTITTLPFKNNAGTLQTGLSGLRVVALELPGGGTALNSAGNTTHATTAVLTLSDAALTTGNYYGVVTISSDGTVLGIERIQAT